MVVASSTQSLGTSFDTGHEDMIHDAQLDAYGKRLATCSSDRCVRIFEIEDDQTRQVAVLKGHEGPVWQISWAHPQFGNILASCSYDSKVFIWKEIDGNWLKIREHAFHTASVNSISWAPHDSELVLACGSSDGKVSILRCKADGTWTENIFPAHQVGVNSVSWAPSVTQGSLTAPQTSEQPKAALRLATGGCDNVIRIWKHGHDGTWTEESKLDGHTDWVRDVAWAPSLGLANTYLASCGQDKQVFIWTSSSPSAPWTKRPLRSELFPDVVWRVSWSSSGNILAVSCGDNKVTLWKENLDGEWQIVGDVVEGQVPAVVKN